MAKAWCLLPLLLLLGVVRQRGHPGVLCDSGETGLTLQRWTAAMHKKSPAATQSQDTPAQPVKADKTMDDAEVGEEEEEEEGSLSAEKETEEKTNSEIESSEENEDGSKDGAMETMSDTAPAATSRMLLVEEDLPASDNVTNTRDLLTWRLKDTSLLDELTNKILGSSEDLGVVSPVKGGSAKGSVSPDGELLEEKGNGGGGGGQSEAASKVVETRVAAPAQYVDQPDRPDCDPQKSLTCLSTDENLELRQQLLQDLQTSFNAPLPSRIRYRLKKKPSIYAIYTSKTPSTRLDIGIPDIYETEVMVTPKHRRQPFSRKPGLRNRDEVYGFAADRKFQQYVLPKPPKYVAIEALATPAYPDTTKDAVTKPFIPLDRNHDADQSGLVFRPPRRPPGSQKRRTNGLLRRPTTGEPHYFTPAPERLSIQSHLQYRRPVSFRYSRTKASPRDDDPTLSTTPIQEAHTTKPHPFVSVTSPRHKAAVVAIPIHRHQDSSPGSAEGYSTKAAGYSEPSDHYLSPDEEYETPATTQQQPKADYKPPAEDYTEAPEKYLPDSEEYTAPDAPSQPPRKYLSPNEEYEAPESQYQPTAKPQADPPQEYLTPDKEYESSEGDGEHRARPYTEPQRTYIPPNRKHEAPKNRHKAPSQAYKLPPRHYLPPNREYMAPPKRPLPLAMGHMAPVMGFAQPPRTYVPPDKEFGSHRKAPGSRRPPHRRRRPSKRRRKNKKRPTPPSRHYIPPNKEYAGAKPDAKPHPGTPPSRTYLAPDKSAPHLPAPPHATKVPLEYNTPPVRTYEPPSKEYISPDKDASLVHSDSLTMTTMASVFLTSPARTYISPDRDYQTPSLALGQAYRAPTQRYETPTKEYISPKTGPHGTVLPSWLMSIKQGHAPPGLEDKVKGYTTNPTPPPGYHPDHTQRKNHFPSTKPAAGYEEPPHRETVYQLPGATYHPPEPTYHPPEPTYQPPPTVYHPPDPAYHPPDRRPPHPGGPTPSPDYSTPARTYELPIREYIPPDKHYLPITPRPAAASGAYVPPGPPVRDYKLPTTRLPYVPPPPPPIHLPIDPNYLPQPPVTYLPPVRDYQAPASYVGGTTASYGPTTAAPAHPSLPPGYVPPSSPGADYVPPTHPKPDYVPPVTPKPHFTTIVITPLSTPAPEYVPPPSLKPDYVPPASPKPDYVPPASPKPDYVPPASPKPDYVPPPSPKPDYVPPAAPKPDYVPPASPKPDYVPPAAPKPDYVPPETSTAGAPHHPHAAPTPGYHVTTYKPVFDDNLQKLQDFSYPGSGRVSHHPARPSLSPRYNATATTYAPPVHDPTTYAPPVYTPTTYGPGYNDLPASVRPTGHPPNYPSALYYDDDYDDDYYYYYHYDDYDYDYDYYDDDDYYYYYYDDDYDYDYGPYHAPLRRPVPYHRIPQADYHIDDNEILDFGYIAGIPGRAGRDYPILSYIPLTSFGCDLVADYPGYYADMEAGCQVFHICHRNGRQDSFLCPNGTIFNQKYFVCDWWYNFACEDAPFFYPVNAAIGHPGVPLHKSAFEPDLHAVHHLPPRHPPQTHHQHHSRHRATRAPGHNFATPSPVQHAATPLPTHHATAPSPTHHPTAASPLRHPPQQRITIVPRLGYLPEPGHTSSRG